ncbi:hypothetical protein RclHR1_12930007 [Rhizophagus clarus]|uniref:Uncharacterized protein n=1 Tax=Rhizophagus clarus TaxID=94130 RepID=A0A2Z6Q8G9_9GLOM|nr:hypothetical protein RclHR1_12930007 [Rhizophagus clarus]
MKRVLSDYTNSQTLKKIKQPEALQELYRLRPEFNGKPVYFFCKKTLYIEGLLVYDKQDKIFYVFDKTTGEKFNSFASWIKTKPIPYWKNYNSATIIEVTSLIKKNINSKQEFFSVGLKGIINGIGIIFFGKGQRIVKNLIFKWQGNLISYELYVLEKNIKEIDGVATKIAIERTLSEIEKIINYVLKAKICTGQMTEGFENVVQLRGIHLVRNQKNPNNIHEPFAILENKSQPDEAYRRIDCLLLVINTNICKNCQKLKNTLIKIRNRNSMSTLPTKVAHASQEVLAKKILDLFTKGTASLRENLKSMRSSHSTTENKKPSLMKKANLPTNPAHALEQLRVWAQLEEVEDSFAKMFLVSELLWLIWAFGTSTPYKKKQKLVPIIISNLKNRSPFTDEALNKELFS